MSSWYQLEAGEVAARLGTDLSLGLTTVDAARRLQDHGANELVDRGSRSAAAILWNQLTGTMVLLLLAAAVVSAALRDLTDAVAIGAIVVFNAVLGFIQEFRAERAIVALRQFAAPRARVWRDGSVRDTAARDLVPGDLVLLEAGNIVPADARLVRSATLRTQEASLTGESDGVDKTAAPLTIDHAAIGDRRNMVFMGTSVTYGRGTAIVTATGMRTELGTIAASLRDVRGESTPLQKRLDALGRALAVAALVIVGVIFTLGLTRGEPLRLMFLTAVSMAVAAVPEGLPAVVTIALALGAQRMLGRKALIRRLAAVETLGSVTVICSDKTGTLTENRMQVTTLGVEGRTIALDESAVADLGEWITPEPPAQPSTDMTAAQPQLTTAILLAAGTLCNDASEAAADAPTGPSGNGHAIGDPTETAIVDAARRFGLRKEVLDRGFPRVDELPFDSERKRMTTVHAVETAASPLVHALQRMSRDGGRTGVPTHAAFTKGAVDRLIEICTQIWDGGRAQPLNEARRAEVLRKHDALAGEGMRVIGVACRPLWDPAAIDGVERDLVFIGVIGMIDPPRAEGRAAVATCVAAGIRPVMITGDHPLTAQYVAGKLGIPAADHVVTGAELDRMTAGELVAAVGRVAVFARVSPQHKFGIVEALQGHHQIVAMTGDGVNDAPALKKADIGVAMGITGTDVSKEAADAVLLDDNFATIVSAVEEGRIIYDNIRKFVKYLLTTNSAELWLMLVAPLAGMPLPLVPLQILWINLVTDGPPALALGIEPAERGVMQRPPRPPGESVFAGGLGRHVIWVGLLMGALTLALGYWYWRSGSERWQTIVFTTLALAQMAHVLAIRSDTHSLFRIGLLSNPLLAAAVASTILLQLALIYVPALRDVFSTVPLSLADVAVCVTAAATVFVAVEIEKWFVRSRRSQRYPS